MPAAAVIPAPIAYVKVAAVKKLIVERGVPRDAPPPSRGGDGTAPGLGDPAHVARREADGGTGWGLPGKNRGDIGEREC